MNYKKLINNQNTRFAILSALSWIPDRVMLAMQYKIKLGRKCNFSNLNVGPRNFSSIRCIIAMPIYFAASINMKFVL